MSIPEKRCDLILKGGITSGVVYPKLILKCAEKFRFHSLGGTSAGAIAAGLAAAAEYNRADGGFERLAELPQELGTQLQTLFQPAPQHKTLFRYLLRGLGWANHLANNRPGPFKTAMGLGVAFLMGPFLFALLGRIGWLGYRSLKNLKRTYFGLCSGLTQPKTQTLALTDWLNRQLEWVAGRLAHINAELPSKPLTFGDLEQADLHLKMITTDLSRQNPICIPFNHYYAFKPHEMQDLFPDPIVNWLICKGRKAPNGLVYLPKTADLPVLFAIRLSLSFPILLAAIPLYQADHSLRRQKDSRKRWQRCWLSDGGISSNFPIHLFDAPIPTRPTFGISLEPFHRDRQDPDPQKPSDNRIFLPHHAGSGLQRPIHLIQSLPQFISSILDAARNWQDAQQSILPGYRERIVHIALKPQEGGLNLTMSEQTIQNLTALGALAGQKLIDDFDFTDHRWRRFISTYAAIESAFEDLAELQNNQEFQALLNSWQRLSVNKKTWPHTYYLGQDRTQMIIQRMRGLFGLAEQWADIPIRNERQTCPKPRTSLKFMPQTFE
ncbi:MAG: patatin-like phospholipase family protein [Acidobacteria bacterium]|nr:patatin-like phospholipase family protein [Acidobacteriota bacterium]